MQTRQPVKPLTLATHPISKGLFAIACIILTIGCASFGPIASPATTRTAVASHKQGSIIFNYQGHTQQVLAVAWSPDGKRIASGSRDGTVQVWNALTGTNVYIYYGHSNAVSALAWSPDSRFIASASWDKTVQVWNAATGQHHLTYQGHTADVNAVVWSPDGHFIASASTDTTVQVWNSTTGQQRLTYRGHTASVTSLTWSPDSQDIASASEDTTAQVWNATTGQHLLTYRGHTKTITSIAWSPDGHAIASGSIDKSVQVWSATTGQVLYTYHGYNVEQAQKNPAKGVLPDVIYAVAWSHNGRWLAVVTQVYCGDDCGIVLVWNASTGKQVSFFLAPPMFALVWSPDDQYFATAVGNSSVEIEQAR